jgi:RimJ/RimL family protein N-acetyltransferase
VSELFPDRIETDRLVLDPLHDVDVLRYYELCAGDDGIEEVTEYVPWTPHDTPKETAEFLETKAEQWVEGTNAEYVIRPAAGEDGAGTIAGATGLGVDWDRRTGSFGLWLRKRFWGRGYSGERAAALMAVAFDHLDLDLIEVTHMDGNEKSRKAIEGYIEAHGGRHEGCLRGYERADLERGGAVDAHRYTVTREEFEANRGAPPRF